FNFSDIDGDTLVSVKVTTLETVGALQLQGIDVTLNQVISKADIDAGKLTFVPVGNDSGTSYDSFGFSVNDGAADSASAYTMTVDVNDVNDAPTFISATGDGIVTTPIGSGGDNGQSVTVQSDGRILVAGFGWNGSNYDFALTRYNADGSLDTSFDTDGILTTPIGSGDDVGQSVTVQADGKILVAGYSHNGTDYDFALTRYNVDGSLDTTFDGDGTLTTDFGSGDNRGLSVTVQSDGKILVAGRTYNGTDYDFALTRYNADGSLDTSFDLVSTLDGTPTFTEGGAAVVLDADVTVSDAELDALNGGLGNYDGASVTLVRNGGASAEDVFTNTGLLSALTESGALVYNGTTIGTVTTNSGGTLLLTFNTNATSALVDSTLQSIAYSNSSDAPPASTQIDWSFDDGNTGSQGTGGALQGLGSTTVTITPANDDPTAANNTISTDDGTPYAFTAANFNFSDIDGDTLVSVKVTTLETVGALQLQGIDVTLNQVISKADIDAG
ncbi:MAG: hypothetical protein GY949_11930, partial [Gammaproteobacteria bacterium]|nr:hypothetical protein [Gammaproteobacteria bacterium]